MSAVVQPQQPGYNRDPLAKDIGQQRFVTHYKRREDGHRCRNERRSIEAGCVGWCGSQTQGSEDMQQGQQRPAQAKFGCLQVAGSHGKGDG
jgi:hypothetical protein